MDRCELSSGVAYPDTAIFGLGLGIDLAADLQLIWTRLNSFSKSSNIAKLILVVLKYKIALFSVPDKGKVLVSLALSSFFSNPPSETCLLQRRED
jgi:hypothetical protein